MDGTLPVDPGSPRWPLVGQLSILSSSPVGNELPVGSAAFLWSPDSVREGVTSSHSRMSLLGEVSLFENYPILRIYELLTIAISFYS